MMCGLFARMAGTVLVIAVCAACAGPAAESGPENSRKPSLITVEQLNGPAGNNEAEKSAELLAALEQIAEIERTGAFSPGLGLAESALRERAGDFAGAAVAAYKELSWAYGHGGASRAQVEEGLRNALELLGDTSPAHDPVRGPGALALKGCLAFAREEWEQAEEYLSGISAGDEEPDSFLRWMLLVCAFERKTGDDARAGRSSYGAIRARYALFPEYWYRGARAFRGGGSGDDNISAAYAEQCINISPRSPFAAESRKILFALAGLPSPGVAPNGRYTTGDTHSDIRTRAEIEYVIRTSVSINDPAILEDLFPLMALPDNPYTLYAQGALRALSAAPEYKTFFTERAQRSSGRLEERLHYISRG